MNLFTSDLDQEAEEFVPSFPCWWSGEMTYRWLLLTHLITTSSIVFSSAWFLRLSGGEPSGETNLHGIYKFGDFEGLI